MARCGFNSFELPDASFEAGRRLSQRLFGRLPAFE
jgi:hypothetical protein